MISDMLDELGALTEAEEAVEAELTGATILATMSASADLAASFVEDFIPQIEARPGPVALALLLAVGAVASGTHHQIATAATAAADRLTAAGVPPPRWAADLAEPLQAVDLMRLRDQAGTLSVLVSSFQRAGNRHACLVAVDHQDCGAATDIFVVDTEQLPEMLGDLREDGLVVTTQAVDPAEFRWYVEDALDARAVHDEEPDADAIEDDEDDEDEGPPYPVLAALLRARLTTLPPARQPAGVRAHHEADTAPVGAGGLPTFGMPAAAFGSPAPAKLPAKRKTADGPAPIYQIKIGLRDAKPPIWRRVLVQADVSLARLHSIIQIAFGWDDSHMHVFETPYGDFGRPDRELGYRAEKPVTLEQVAQQAKDKIQYTYDFGDSWSHEILVEKVLARDPALSYPRCVGGRRAAPPDDSGGIWGYESLVEALTDPRHPDHQDRLEWMGLDDASQFDAAAFDPEQVNQALAKLR